MKKTFIIAEAGVNHNGSLERAFEMVQAAARSGADAVKFQTFNADSLVTRSAAKARYQGETGTQYEMLKCLELTEQEFREIFEHCKQEGIEFLSTPFDREILTFLLDLGVKKIKVGSGDMNNADLLVRMGQSGLPVILSTGMADLEEIELSLGAIACGVFGEMNFGTETFRRIYDSYEGKQALLSRVTVLHCTTAYPTPPNQANVLAMRTLAEKLHLPVGYSDHTLGIEAPIAAVALGAEIIEKHFTIDRALPGPDHAASMEPDELEVMVSAIRKTETLLGTGQKGPVEVEKENAPAARKSLVALRPIAKGERFTEQNLGSKRPGGGISPLMYFDYLGKIADRDFETDEAI